MLHLQDRIILKTLDGKIIVRPEATEVDNTIEFNNTFLCLDKRGRDAWNSGGTIEWWHGVWIDKSCLKAEL